MTTQRNANFRFQPDQFLLRANLAEFSHQVGLTSALCAGGKLSTAEAMARLDQLWTALKHTEAILKAVSDTPQDSSQERS